MCRCHFGVRCLDNHLSDFSWGEQLALLQNAEYLMVEQIIKDTICSRNNHVPIKNVEHILVCVLWQVLRDH